MVSQAQPGSRTREQGLAVGRGVGTSPEPQVCQKDWSDPVWQALGITVRHSHPNHRKSGDGDRQQECWIAVCSSAPNTFPVQRACEFTETNYRMQKLPDEVRKYEHKTPERCYAGCLSSSFTLTDCLPQVLLFWALVGTSPAAVKELMVHGAAKNPSCSLCSDWTFLLKPQHLANQHQLHFHTFTTGCFWDTAKGICPYLSYVHTQGNLLQGKQGSDKERGKECCLLGGQKGWHDKSSPLINLFTSLKAHDDKVSEPEQLWSWDPSASAAVNYCLALLMEIERGDSVP